MVKNYSITNNDNTKPNLLIKKKLTHENFYKLIYTKILKFKSDYNALKYFEENLFDRLSVSEIWDRVHLGD